MSCSAHQGTQAMSPPPKSPSLWQNRIWSWDPFNLTPTFIATQQQAPDNITCDLSWGTGLLETSPQPLLQTLFLNQAMWDGEGGKPYQQSHFLSLSGPLPRRSPPVPDCPNLIACPRTASPFWHGVLGGGGGVHRVNTEPESPAKWLGSELGHACALPGVWGH